MAMLREWLDRLLGTLRFRRADHDLEEELRLHQELTGQTGGIAQAMDSLRDQRGLPWLEDLARDLRDGSRMLARNPGFTIVAVASLAIGIGATCAVFSFADALLLRPLAVPRPAEVLTVGTTAPLQLSLIASYREYVDIRDRSQSFDGLAAFTTAMAAFASEPDAPPKVRMGMLVSGNFFAVMGVEPRIGRAFRPEEDQVPGRDAVVMLGHDFWVQQFGADPSVLGRTVRLSGIEFTVIGVTPAYFTGLDQYTRFEFYAPLMMWARLMTDRKIQPFEARDFRSLTIKGRLEPGATMSQAQTELSLIARDLERAYPDTNRNRGLSVRTELQTRIEQVPPVVRLLAMLATLAGAVLFVACANVAGLLTSRAPVRAREMALRLAIGAGRSRLIRQLITESVLIAAIGGVLALGVGYGAVRVFRQFQIPTDLPIVASFELDQRALMFSLAVAMVSAVLFGLAPAIRATRTDLTAVMKATDAAGFGRRRRSGRALLVGGQVAVSVIVLVIATLMYRSFLELVASGPGYRTDHLLQMSFDPALARYTGPQAQRFFEQVAERARSVPGVRSAALASSAPTDVGPSTGVTIVPEGFQFPAGEESVTVLGSTVDEHYFDTVQLPIVKGRGFRATDSGGAPLVAVVNEQLAARYWAGRDPLGKRFRLNDGNGPWVEIVGVAKNAKYILLSESPRPFVYLPYRQRPQQRMTIVVESIGDPASLAAPLREVVRGLDANLPISNVRTLAESYRMRMVTIYGVVIQLVAAMGIMGLGLAIVGLYGLVAYAARRRTREIGIRMAIGADRSTVLLMIVRQGLVLAVAGLGAGLIAAAGARGAMSATFPGGVSARGLDIVSFLLVAATVLAVTVIAAYIPARRASCINPTEALRHE